MKIIREFFQIAAANRRLIFVYAVAIPTALLGCIVMKVNNFDLYKLTYSRSDLILFSMIDSFILIAYAILMLYFIMFLLRYDFMTSVLIRQHSKRSIWFQQAGKAAIFSFFAALYSTVFLTLFSSFFSSTDNNWDYYNSVYAYMMHFELDHTVPLPVIIALLFVFLFYFLFVMTLLYLVFKWNFHSEAIGCIVVIVYLLYCGTDYTILNYLTTCAVQYGDFANPIRLLWPLLAPLLWIGVLLGAGALLANRAEFYSAGKK